jgi:glutathione S-transferase
MPNQTDTLAFYFSPGSSSMAPHIALHEIGAKFEPRPLFLGGANKEPAYLEMNPEGKVPVLLVNGKPLTEVAAILFYLAKSFPGSKLLPNNLDAEVRAISWMSYVASALHPARTLDAEPRKRVFLTADKKLGRPDWILGDYSIADIHLFRLFWRYVENVKSPAGTFPNLEAHYERMMERPAVKKTIEIENALKASKP